ncbi:hypothetical protein SCALM49S_05460 [Streptomyces californicus]
MEAGQTERSSGAVEAGGQKLGHDGDSSGAGSSVRGSPDDAGGQQVAARLVRG